MKYRREYNKIKDSIPETALDPKTKALLDDFGKYFQKFPNHNVINLDVFIPRFRQWHAALTEEQFNVYKGILRQVPEDVDDDTRAGIVSELNELSLATTLANTAVQFEEGNLEIPLSDVVGKALDAYKLNQGVKLTQWNDQSIEELIKEDEQYHGVKWRLECLNVSMRPMRGGDFGIIAGRPDKGKTSFLASEITHMAAQIPEDRNILWLNNEGLASRIKRRIYQSAFGMSWTEISNLYSQGKPVMEAYAQIIGRRDRIRVMDIHGFHIGQVEELMGTNSPGIVVFDMIDRIRGFGAEARTDLQLEEMYAWARERCVKYDFIGLATSQVSGDGEGEQFPRLDQLKDSKTGKQGACDFLLMIGASNDPNLRYARYLSLPKNKLRRDDAPGDPRCEVIFKPTTARYEDIYAE